jgi:hypothetical protein
MRSIRTLSLLDAVGRVMYYIRPNSKLTVTLQVESSNLL